MAKLALGMLLLAAAGCGGGGDPPATGDDAGPDQPAATRVVFEPGDGTPTWGRVPFPSDLYRDADGTLSRIPGLEALVPASTEIFQVALDALDGFGLTPSIVFFVDPAPAEVALPAGAVLLVDPEGATVPLITHWDAEESRILATPATGVVLREGVTYVAALTTLADAGEAPLVRDAATEALLAGEGDARLAGWSGAIDRAAAAAGGRDALLAVTTFTTQRVTQVLASAREQLEAMPRPVPRFDEEGVAPFHPAIFTATTDPSLEDWLGETGKDADGRDLPAFADGVAHDQLALVATGAFEAVTFRRPDTGTDGPEDETFELDADGRPIPQGTVRIPFSIALPAGPPPSDAGYPVMIVQHGLNGDRSFLLAFANTAARAGVATVAIEAVAHGSRGDPDDEQSTFEGTYQGPDGFADGGSLAVLEFFEEFTNLLGARDSFRESALGHAQLARMVSDPALDLSALDAALGAPAPRLDGTRVYYVGDSLGGILGTITTAIEPTISLSILNVPGAGIVQRLLPRAPRSVDLVQLLVSAVFGVTAHDMFTPASPSLALMQSILDAGDPQAYAPHLLEDRLEIGGAPIPPRDVVLFEVDRDELVSNESTAHLAIAAGVAQLDPGLWPIDGLEPVGPIVAGNHDGVTALLVQIGPAIHGANVTMFDDFRYFYPERDDPEDPFEALPEPILVPCPVVGMHRMIEHLLTTRFAAPAELVPSLTPTIDFDGDGTPDADDPAPWGD